MKTSHFILLLVSALVLSCTQTTEPLETYSPDHQMKIVVSSQRPSALDPWTAEIELTHAGSIDKVVQEFYADRADISNITFEWKSNSTCIIHIKQRDGIIIHIPVSIK